MFLWGGFASNSSPPWADAGTDGRSISGERGRQTLELLLSTQATPLQIVTGKLFSSLSHAALLIVSSFPIIALVVCLRESAWLIWAFLILLVITLPWRCLPPSRWDIFRRCVKNQTMALAVSYGTAPSPDWNRMS